MVTRLADARAGRAALVALLLLAPWRAGAADAPPPTQMPIPVPSQPTPTPPPPPPGGGGILGELALKFRGMIVVNASYNDGTLIPGNFVALASPAPLSESQFFISPSNTVLGFTLSGITIHGAQLSGGLDINLRSPQPLLTANTILPQFYDAYIQLEGERWRAILGQYPDVVLTFIPDTTNSFPAGYIPGSLGYVRPQLRGEIRVPFADIWQVIFKASAGQPIQTFQLADTEVGRQGGLPDGQARLSLAVGSSRLAWERPFEIGGSGHIGRRRITDPMTAMTQSFRTWSLSADVRARAPTGTLFKGRLWRGSVLGDYTAGVFQTIDVVSHVPIRATGLWFEVQQTIGPRWRVTAGYGRDNPFDSDLSPGARTLNQAGFLNTEWEFNRMIGLGAEVSRWATTYVGTGTNRVWRGDLLLSLRF